jgi:hypothetical protein
MLQNRDYCPLLHARISEMKALLQLSAATKDRIFPVIVGRPWPNANRLQRTWDKIAEAFGGRPFGLDLDQTRRGYPSSRVAATEFNDLFDSANGYQAYYEAVESVPGAVPVLRTSSGADRAGLEAELRQVERVDRGLVVRVQNEVTAHADRLISTVFQHHPEFVLLIDAGWDEDLLTHVAWASGVIAALPEDHDTIEVVACGSSFPESFTNIDGRGSIRVLERSLFDELVRRHNRTPIVYGDWASTRPPRESTPMTPVPRIDLPMSREWVAFRRNEAEGYADIARRVIADQIWPNDLNIWGTYTIDATANELPGMIKSPATASAVRINIHMHRQTHFGEQALTSDGDEPFTDD